MRNKAKLKLYLIVTYLIQLAYAQEDGIDQISYSCKIYNLQNKKEYFGRVLIQQYEETTGVRITAYEEEKINSDGFYVHYAVNNRDVKENLSSKRSISLSQNVAIEWFSRRGESFRTAKTIGQNSTTDDPESKAKIEFLNIAPYSVKNLANRLRINSNYTLNGETVVVDLAFRDFKILTGWVFCLIFSIIFCLVPCIMMLPIFIMVDSYRERDELKKISVMVWFGLLFYTILGIRMIVMYWSMFAWPIFFYPIFSSLQSCVLSKYSLSDNYYDKVKGPLILVMTIILALVAVINFFSFSHEYMNHFFFYGNFAVFLDIFLAYCYNDFKNYRVKRNVSLMMLHQTPFLFLIFYPNNLWYVPNGVSWEKFWIYVAIWLGSYALFIFIVDGRELIDEFCCCCLSCFKKKKKYKSKPPKKKAPPAQKKKKGPKNNTPIGKLEFKIEQKEEKIVLVEKELNGYLNEIKKHKKSIVDIEKKMGQKETEIGKLKGEVKNDVKNLEKLITDERVRKEKERKEKEERERKEREKKQREDEEATIGKLKELKGKYGSDKGMNYPKEEEKVEEEVKIKKGMIGNALPYGDHGKQPQGYQLPQLPGINEIHIRKD